VLPFQAADQGTERHLGSKESKPTRQALPDQWSNPSGDLFKISAWMNRAMSLQKHFLSQREQLADAGQGLPLTSVTKLSGPH
jgi:hypothetical protein